MNRYLKMLLVVVTYVNCRLCNTGAKYDAEVLTSIDNQSMEGKTYGLFPPDEIKVRKIEIQMIPVVRETTSKLKGINGTSWTQNLSFEFNNLIG